MLEVAIRDLSKPPSAKPVVEGEKPPEATKEDKSAKGKKGKVVCVAYSCTLICDFFIVTKFSLSESFFTRKSLSIEICNVK